MGVGTHLPMAVRALLAGNQLLQKEAAVDHQELDLKSESIRKKKKITKRTSLTPSNCRWKAPCDPMIMLPKNSPEWPVRERASWSV